MLSYTNNHLSQRIRYKYWRYRPSPPTYRMIKTMDPASSCDSSAGGNIYCRFHPTVCSLQDLTHSLISQTKIFTIVSTFT